MAKYPGSQIIFEVGTRSELANIYGVSERTIYRWLNKAAAESGLSPEVKKKVHPRPETLANFKGTRKQLAKKYGVSERTVYRWLNKAAQGGTSIPTRRTKSNYPGVEILAAPGTNKQLADKFGVSTRTISRWKSKARVEALHDDTQQDPLSDFEIPDENPEVNAPETDNFELPPEDEIPEDFDDFADFDISEEMFGNLKGINEVVLNNDLTNSDIFKGLTYKEKILYLNNYLMYQYDQDPAQFYDSSTHKFRFDTEWVTEYVDIWGDEFDNWVERQFESDMYEI